MPNNYTSEGVPIITKETREVLARDIVRRTSESDGNEQIYFEKIRDKIRESQPQIERFIQLTEERYVNAPGIKKLIIQNILYTYELLERQEGIGSLENIPLEPRPRPGINPFT